MIYLDRMGESFKSCIAEFRELGGTSPTHNEELYAVYMLVLTVASTHGRANREQPVIWADCGTAKGATAIVAARAFKDCKLWFGGKRECRVITIDSDGGKRAKEAERIISSVTDKHNYNIDIVIGNSLSVLNDMRNNSLCGIFIDTWHDRNHVRKELDLAIKKVRRRGIIAGHDYDLGNIGVPMAVDEWRKEYEGEIMCWRVTRSVYSCIRKPQIRRLEK